MTTLTPSKVDIRPDGDEGGTSFWTATRLVAEREVRSFLRTKGFWIGLAVIVAGLFAAGILPSVFAGGPPSVAAVGPQAAQMASAAELDVREVADIGAARELVRTEEVEAAMVPDAASGVRVLALNDPPTDVVMALSVSPPVDLLEPGDVGPGARQLVIMVFALVFLMVGMGGMAIAQSTVTEKQTRIVEILVVTVPVRALLAGKVLGHTLLTVLQVAVIAVAGPVALSLGGQSALLAVVAPALGWFVPFVCAGFVLLAGMWAVAGSVVSRQEDLGSSIGLVMMLVMGPYFAVMFASGNATLLGVLSYLPFSAAVAMPVRLFTGEAQAWEALVSLGVLAVSVVLIVALASRLYTGALLQTGGKVALAKAWRSRE
ncbi:ABC transporter permease [Amycolatopsis endophytica]|uniref:ABC-2 type transport system permease protein n=1 Tax=Amycolatopsis endophytica TaxID=860233 RepID=A0A853B9G7_9PSEU|nr:ABC transporter permease [Amycolatopsis endophytica]NYI91445.1 ABC-2 type transport system permease protein [Amycolatopsis endophytica]